VLNVLSRILDEPHVRESLWIAAVNDVVNAAIAVERRIVSQSLAGRGLAAVCAAERVDP
jgi:hypothetical protein